MKKSIYTLLFIGASALSVQAQSCVPDFLSTVAVVRNTDGTPITTAVDLQVELYYGDPSTTGTKIYCEQQQNIIPNSFGEVSVQFGSVGPNLCPPNVPLSSINWDNCTAGEVWYRIYWRVTGGSLALIAENNFATVPYAFLSRKAENLAIPATNGQVLTYNSTLGKWVAGNNDNSPTNEIQTLSVNGTDLNLSNGGGTASLLAYNAGSGISISGNVISQNTDYAQGFNPDPNQTQLTGQTNASWYTVPQCNVTVPSTGTYLVSADAFFGYSANPQWLTVGIFSGSPIPNTVLAVRQVSAIPNALVQTVPISRIMTLTAGQVLTLRVKSASLNNINFGYGGEWEPVTGLPNTSSISIIKLAN